MGRRLKARTANRTPPTRVRARAFAKINLGLEVLDSRHDGYHELRTLFQTISLCDEIEITRRRSKEILLDCDHPLVPRDDTNLALRAARDLLTYAGFSAGVAIRLVKRIPVAGGLGGGSSDAAAVLLALNRLLDLRLGPSDLHPLARRLGADVPFFLVGGTALGLGRGDEVYPLQMQISAPVVIVDLARPISTPAVFRRADTRLTPKENSYTIFRFVSGALEGRAPYRVLTNELERSALEEAPDLEMPARRVHGILKAGGALLASLSGSGSSYFGLFDDPMRARRSVHALRAAGFAAHPARTVTLGEFRKAWSLNLGRQASKRHRQRSGHHGDHGRQDHSGRR